MRRKKYFVILICLLLLSLSLFAVACNPNGNNQERDTLSIEYLYDSNTVTWKASWAEKFSIFFYFGENADGVLKYNENNIMSTDNHRELGRYIEQSGSYFIIVFAYKGDKVMRETMTVNILLHNDDDQPPIQDDNENGYKYETGKLKSVYYHLAKSNNNLSIPLVNQNGVQSVSGFEMSKYSDWSYEKRENSLVISGIYLNKFSSGARLSFDVEYMDGKSDKMSVQLVDELPMDVIKGRLGNSLIGYTNSDNIGGVITISNLALNLEVYLGYGNKVASEVSSKYVKEVSIDGKRLLSSAYSLSSKESKITLTSNKSFSGLTQGMHLLEIYTIHGKSEVWIYVNGNNAYPVNVAIDFDTCYPNVYITWDMMKDDAQEYIVKINDMEYGSNEYSHLFDGNKFNATDIIKYNDEVRVSAVFDGKSYTSLKVSLDVDISNLAIKDYLSYDEVSFEYLGTRYNTFIDDYDELKDLIFYSLIHYDKVATSAESGYEKSWRIYVNPSLATNAKDLMTKVNSAVDYFNEGVKADWQVIGGYNLNTYEIDFTVQSTCIPDDIVRDPTIKENGFNDTHFSKFGRNNKFDDFAVNNLQKTAPVTYSEELYLAIERGVRPIPIKGSPAEKVYEKAKDILRAIIDDSMNDFQKVHAIVDWLSCSVTYNWALADELGKASPSSSDYNKYYAYRELYLEGAILDGLAVCNGYAKAVSLLCGIEGIQCYKIKGASGEAQHAWNKAYIDGDWYVVDSTWTNERYQQNSNAQIKEILKHNTIFMSEEQSGNKSGGAHKESYLGDYSGYFAGMPYDLFANTFFMYDGNLYDMVIDDADELEILLKYLVSSKGEYMGRGNYVRVDVRCDSGQLEKYISTLRSGGLDIFASYGVSVEYKDSYGSMASIVFSKFA